MGRNEHRGSLLPRKCGNIAPSLGYFSYAGCLGTESFLFGAWGRGGIRRFIGS